jgi:hypothetical protein
MSTLTKALTAAAGNAGVADTANVEDVFSTYLYDGNGGTQTITNGIDLEGEGGMVWIKDRDDTYPHALYDSEQGPQKTLETNSTAGANSNYPLDNTSTAFKSNGFRISTATGRLNTTDSYVSWTFRKAPRFFDCITYSGDGTTNREISHNLGVVPGMVVIKATNQTDVWYTHHRSLGFGQYLDLSGTNYANQYGAYPPISAATDSNMTLVLNTGVNGSTSTYVAYLFAHDPVGENNDGMIACGSYTGTGEVDLGWEPQYILSRCSTTNANWKINDSMRGLLASASGTATLAPNSNAIEETSTMNLQPTGNGFNVGSLQDGGGTYIYMAIRAPMMKEPESATEVFEASYGLDASANNGKVWEAGFPVDMYFRTDRTGGSNYLSDRIRGSINYLVPHGTQAESSVPYSDRLDNQTGVYSTNPFNYSSGPTWAGWMFKRAKGFFDIAAYTGNYSANPQMPHSLGVAPEMIIAKSRDSVGQWYIKHTGMDNNKDIYFNANAASPAAGWSATATHWQMQAAQYPYDPHIAYLFASLDGVSKVGSYTGTGHGDGEPLYGNIDCGFSNGARFVMIKRIDSTGDWFFWDTNRGINTGNDPHLSMNLQAGEVTSDDSIDPYPAGFSVNQNTTTHINVYQATYIFLAIA